MEISFNAVCMCINLWAKDTKSRYRLLCLIFGLFLISCCVGTLGVLNDKYLLYLSFAMIGIANACINGSFGPIMQHILQFYWNKANNQNNNNNNTNYNNNNNDNGNGNNQTKLYSKPPLLILNISTMIGYVIGSLLGGWIADYLVIFTTTHNSSNINWSFIILAVIVIIFDPILCLLVCNRNINGEYDPINGYYSPTNRTTRRQSTRARYSSGGASNGGRYSGGIKMSNGNNNGINNNHNHNNNNNHSTNNSNNELSISDESSDNGDEIPDDLSVYSQQKAYIQQRMMNQAGYQPRRYSHGSTMSERTRATNYDDDDGDNDNDQDNDEDEDEDDEATSATDSTVNLSDNNNNGDSKRNFHDVQINI